MEKGKVRSYYKLNKENLEEAVKEILKTLVSLCDKETIRKMLEEIEV